MSRRVVITGMGTINPLANNVQETWDAMLAGVSGIDRITSFEIDDYRCQIGGELKNFDPNDYHLDAKLANKMDRSQQIAFACTLEAAKMAKLPMTHPEDHSIVLPGFENMKAPVEDPYRMGVMFGIGVGDLSFQKSNFNSDDRGAERVSPFVIPKMIINLCGWLLHKRLMQKGLIRVM